MKEVQYLKPLFARAKSVGFDMFEPSEDADLNIGKFVLKADTDDRVQLIALLWRKYGEYEAECKQGRNSLGNFLADVSHRNIGSIISRDLRIKPEINQRKGYTEALGGGLIKLIGRKIIVSEGSESYGGQAPVGLVRNALESHQLSGQGWEIEVHAPEEAILTGEMFDDSSKWYQEHGFKFNKDKRYLGY